MTAERDQLSDRLCSPCDHDGHTCAAFGCAQEVSGMTATDRAMAREEWARIRDLEDRVTIDDALIGDLRDRIRELEVENELLRAILDGCDDAAIERAARALHDRTPWVYGQDADGEDVTKPWDEAAESVRESYLTDALVALRAAGEMRAASRDSQATNGDPS